MKQLLFLFLTMFMVCFASGAAPPVEEKQGITIPTPQMVTTTIVVDDNGINTFLPGGSTSETPENSIETADQRYYPDAQTKCNKGFVFRRARDGLRRFVEMDSLVNEK